MPNRIDLPNRPYHVVTDKFAIEGRAPGEAWHVWLYQNNSSNRLLHGSVTQHVQTGSGMALVYYGENVASLEPDQRAIGVNVYAYLGALTAATTELNVEVDVWGPEDGLNRDPALSQALLDIGFTDPYGDHYFANAGKIITAHSQLFPAGFTLE